MKENPDKREPLRRDNVSSDKLNLCEVTFYYCNITNVIKVKADK